MFLICIAVSKKFDTDILKRFMNTRKTAEMFQPAKRTYNREDLHEECCEGSCDSEERHEFAEEHGEGWVEKTLCELSVRER